MPPRGKTTQLDHMYVADFETCDSWVPVDGEIPDQRVWLAGFKNLETLKTNTFTTLDDFMKAILSRGDNSNTEYGFHNLKFDGSFIIPWLLREGWLQSDGKPTSGEFSVLVDDRNAWYSIIIQPSKRRKVTIWDTVKLFPSQLEYLPDIYQTPTRKIIESQSFYNEIRLEGHQPSQQELDYFENDLQVPAETLRHHIDIYGLRFKKTQASQSFYNFEQIFPAWKWRFSPLSDQDDRLIRPAYWGGISHVPKKKAGKDFYDVGVFDINSSYPHKAAECKLPYGDIVKTTGENEAPDMSKFWVADCIVEFTLKDDCLPCIPSKAIEEGLDPEDKDKWLTKSNGIVRMKMTSIDYYTINESYDFKVWRWMWAKHWKWKIQKEVARFVYQNNDNKVKYRRLAKEEKDPDKKREYDTISLRAKIDNNSFYGKFGEEVIKEGKTPYLEPDGSVRWSVDRYEVQSDYARKFIPVAMAITAWGRRQLVQMANVLGEHFLYCDTDSIHYLMIGHEKIEQAENDGIFEVDPVKLGAWKHEGRMVRGRYLRAKCYMEETQDGEREATVAGLPADKHTGNFSKSRSCLNWDNFYIGHVVPADQANKLRSVRTRSGTKLLPVGFEIKEKQTLFT